jgi:hypothetical protein
MDANVLELSIDINSILIIIVVRKGKYIYDLLKEVAWKELLL